MRAHLATCSVLRSSAYRKYASSLQPCARVDLHPPPAITPTPPEARGRTSLRSSASRILSASPLPERYPLGRGGENENPLSDEERSDSAHLVSGGIGADRGRRVRPGARAGRQDRKRTSCALKHSYASAGAGSRPTGAIPIVSLRILPAEHASRRALIARSAHDCGRG
jgi:hypothetical protein